MAKKNTPQKPQREMTRRHLATWQKQKRRQRFILFSGVGLIVIAVLTVLIGWVVSDAVPRAKTALVVNGVEYTAGDCVEAILLYNSPTPDIVAQSAEQVVPALKQLEIIAQQSAALGISVSDEEIKSTTESSDLSRKDRRLMELILIDRGVMDHFMGQLPATAPQRQVLAMLLDNAAQAETARQELLEGADFTSLAKLISINTSAKEDGGDLGWHQQDHIPSLEKLGSEIPLDWAWQAADGDLSPVLTDPDVMKQGGYWIWMVTERSAEQGSHVYGMKFAELAAAQSARDRVLAGEEFAAVAADVSQYVQPPEGSPGEIGWYLDDGLVASMETFVPGAPLNTPSAPIRDPQIYTNGGYWVVKVAGVDAARAVSLEDLQQQGFAAYSAWVTEVSEESRHQIQNNWEDVREWVIKQVTAEVG